MWVVKLGGSMLHAAELGAWLATCERAPRDLPCVIVIGGGPLVDEVRSLQSAWHFPDPLAHELALDAMAINARVIAALPPRKRLFSELTNPPGMTMEAGCCVWLPRRPYATLQLAPSWSVTSDSIAFRVAERLGARRLVLVKSLARDALTSTRAREYADRGVIDVTLPQLMQRAALPVYLASKFDHERFGAMLRGEQEGVPLSR